MDLSAEVALLWAPDNSAILCVGILCEDSDPQTLYIAQVCAMCLLPFPTIENLRLGVFNEDLFRISTYPWSSRGR